MTFNRRLWFPTLVALASIPGIIIPITSISASPSTQPSTPPPPCQVTIDTNGIGTQAIATIVSGCTAPGFAFRSFVGIGTTTQFDIATAPPWVVNLPTAPPCEWQVDFSFMPGTPQHHFVAGLTGTGPCPPPTTTTTTTVLPPTTTTTVPPTTTTTSPTGNLPPSETPPPQPVPNTTTTTLPSITQERQQIQTPTGTQGNG